MCDLGHLRLTITLSLYSWSLTFGCDWDDKECTTWDPRPKFIHSLLVDWKYFSATISTKEGGQKERAPCRGQAFQEIKRNRGINCLLTKKKPTTPREKHWISSSRRFLSENPSYTQGWTAEPVRRRSVKAGTLRGVLAAALGQDYWPRWFTPSRLVSGRDWNPLHLQKFHGTLGPLGPLRCSSHSAKRLSRNVIIAGANIPNLCKKKRKNMENR